MIVILWGMKTLTRERLRIVSPCCGKELRSSELMYVATTNIRRTCGCGQNWSITITPLKAGPHLEAQFHKLEWTRIILSVSDSVWIYIIKYKNHTNYVGYNSEQLSKISKLSWSLNSLIVPHVAPSPVNSVRFDVQHFLVGWEKPLLRVSLPKSLWNVLYLVI